MDQRINELVPTPDDVCWEPNIQHLRIYEFDSLAARQPHIAGWLYIRPTCEWIWLTPKWGLITETLYLRPNIDFSDLWSHLTPAKLLFVVKILKVGKGLTLTEIGQPGRRLHCVTLCYKGNCKISIHIVFQISDFYRSHIADAATGPLREQCLSKIRIEFWYLVHYEGVFYMFQSILFQPQFAKFY